jgi:hypothetical protein
MSEEHVPAQVLRARERAEQAIQAKAGFIPQSQNQSIPQHQMPTDEVSQLRDELQKSEHRFRVLQGKYNAEVTQVNNRVAALEAELAMNGNKTGTPAPVADDSINLGEYFGKDTIDAYDEGLLKDVARNQKQSREMAESARKESFFIMLRNLIPNYEVIWADQAFRDWLEQPVNGMDFDQIAKSRSPVPVGMGMTREGVLDVAFSRMNVEGVATVFNLFLQGRQQQQPQQHPFNPVLQQISPRAAGSGVTPVNSSHIRIYSGEEYKQLHAQLRSNRLAPDVAAALRTELDAALSQGRVRNQ